MLLAQLVACGPEALETVNAAAARAQVFDLEGALDLARRAGACHEAEGSVEYLEGLLGGREAAKTGGTMDSLRDVRSAINALSRRAEGRGGAWQIASVALRAVAAASQYERGEMTVYLDEAVRLEQIQLAAGQPGAPFITAHELAGDLWLQVHQFDAARRAYSLAAARVGRTPRVLLGLARASARLNDVTAACFNHRSLLEWWGARPGEPQEVAEARGYVKAAPCPGR